MEAPKKPTASEKLAQRAVKDAEKGITPEQRAEKNADAGRRAEVYKAAVMKPKKALGK
jgi:hypothetical protein